MASTVADRVGDRLRGRGADTVFGYVGDRINRLFEGTFDPRTPWSIWTRGRPGTAWPYAKTPSSATASEH